MTTRKPPKRRPKGSGMLRTLPSGKIQAQYTGPDGKRRSAGISFETKQDAAAWLTRQQELVAGGTWQPPVTDADAGTFGTFSETWLDGADLKPSTRALYRSLLDGYILPTFKDKRLTEITVAMVKVWHGGLASAGPTRRAHAYSLLRNVLNAAFRDDLITANPCRVRGGGTARTQHRPVPPTSAEVQAIADAMPARLHAAVLISAWVGTRWGELSELRRKDIDVTALTVRIERAVTRVDGAFVIGAPKSDAGTRTVAMPKRIAADVQHHLDTFTGPSGDSLLFPASSGGNLLAPVFGLAFRKARSTVGRDDLRLHDLRHAAGTWAASTGASQAALKARLGHSTSAASQRYQHAVSGADRDIADALDRMDDAKPSLRVVQ